MPIVLVTGTLTPYNRRLYDAFAETFREDLHVLACTALEPHRSWQVGEPKHFTLHVLPGIRKHVNDIRHIYFNPSVLPTLRRLQPEAIALGAFSPTMVLAGLYARAARIPYGIGTDGALATDPGEYSLPHRLMRQLLVPKAKFGICASEESVKLLARWGLVPARSTVVPLVPPWAPPATVPDFAERPFDILFAGGLNEEIKGALFFTDVAARLKQMRPQLAVRVTGEGPTRREMEARLAAAGVKAHFDGALQPDQMPDVFGSAKIMLFPSRGDVWGLVANEAVQCGTPVLGSPHAISSLCFIERFGLGLVRAIDVDAWSEAALDMLTSESRWASFMQRRPEALAWASLETSVRGLKRAFDIGRGRVEAASPLIGAEA